MIDYGMIDRSTHYYHDLGYKRVESPWTVTPAISNITKPSWIDDPDKFVLKSGKELVASGEQSFLYLYNKGFLPEGKFQTVTPCFRNDSFDETHTKYFIKNELIDTENVTYNEVHKMASIAVDFFSDILKNETEGDFSLKTVIVNHSEDNRQIDIELNGIEIGSYGIRECSFLKWIYGTGLAEPRFSRIVNSLRLPKK